MERLGIYVSEVFLMNIIESLSAITLTSIVLGLTTYSTLEWSQYILKRMDLYQEATGVIHAMNLMARTIRNAGFPSNIREFPKVSENHVFKQTQAITIAKNAGISNQYIGTFTLRKGIASVNQSDAMIVRHASMGHFDCLGQRITESRMNQKISHQGFFLQWTYLGSHKTGQLMCQSLDNNGQLQNSGLLLGVHYLGMELISLSNNKKMVELRLEMASGKSYRRVINLRHDLVNE